MKKSITIGGVLYLIIILLSFLYNPAIGYLILEFIPVFLLCAFFTVGWIASLSGDEDSQAALMSMLVPVGQGVWLSLFAAIWLLDWLSRFAFILIGYELPRTFKILGII